MKLRVTVSCEVELDEKFCLLDKPDVLEEKAVWEFEDRLHKYTRGSEDFPRGYTFKVEKV